MPCYLVKLFVVGDVVDGVVLDDVGILRSRLQNFFATFALAE